MKARLREDWGAAARGLGRGCARTEARLREDWGAAQIGPARRTGDPAQRANQAGAVISPARTLSKQLLQ